MQVPTRQNEIKGARQGNGRTGLFGGSFNPVHCGHLIVARAVAEQLDLARVVFLPSGVPPHKRPAELLDSRHRAQMVRLAIAGEPGFEFSEFDLGRGGPTYTFDTVAQFADQLGAEAELHWIIGADSFPELASWHRISELVNACRIITAARPGWEAPDLSRLRAILTEAQIARLVSGILSTPRIDISSTDIRERIANGRSIRYLVPEGVSRYIEDHRLYAPSPV